MTDTLEIFGTEYTGVTGIKATDDNNQIKTYIRPQGSISITNNGNNIDVSSYATANVSVSGGTPTLETVTKIYTPSTSAVTDTITPSSGYDGIEEVDVTVSAVPNASFYTVMSDLGYSTVNNSRKWKVQAITELDTGEGDVEGWIGNGLYGGQTTTYNAIASGTSVTPTESAQTIGGADYMMEGAVTVNAIPSNYVGSGVTRRTDSDFIFGQNYTLTAPSGYYENDATVQMPYTTHNAPSISVSNSGLITATHTQQTGYIVTGNDTTTATEQLTTRSSSDLTASGATVTAPAGYYASQATKSVASGSATPASTISGTSASVSTGTNTLTLSKTVSNTPQVSAGYISNGTAGNTSVSLTASVTTKAAATITPGTSNQTIASGTYLTGTQTISGDANLVSSNIISGKSIFGVSGNVAFSTIYTGSSAPSSSTGVNGDIYIQS